MSESSQAGLSRRKFMAVGGGSAALAAFLAACGDDSGTTTTTSTMPAKSASGTTSETEQFGKGDVGILNYALTLEYLETAFYADVIKSGLFKGADLAVIKKFGAEEAEHVAALTAAVKQLGGKPAPEPKAARKREGGNRTGGHGREPRRRRLPRAGGQHRKPGSAGVGARHPQRRGPPRGRPQHGARQIDHPRRGVREAGRRQDRPQIG
jgi:hypothetical protein